MNISVIEPINRSLEWTKRVLFVEFNIGKWFVMGFCAFLAGLGEGGCNFGSNLNQVFSQTRESRLMWDRIWNFALEHLALIALIAVGVFIIGFAIRVLILWLSSRGKFMFLDGALNNRGAVVKPWHEFRRRGNSLFIFRFLLDLAGWAVVLLICVLAVCIAWPDITARSFGVNAIVSIVSGGLLLMGYAFVIIIIYCLLNDFCVPIMYRRNISALDAIRTFWRELLPGHVGVFILFYLMKILISIVTGILVLIAFCLTCCIACCACVIPYIGTVVLLPIILFKRCYSVFFLEQFGDGWRFFAPDEAFGHTLPADTDTVDVEIENSDTDRNTTNGMEESL